MPGSVRKARRAPKLHHSMGHDLQKANGVTAQAVYRAIDNPNDITVTHEFATLEAAQAFSKLDELKTAMRTGGVLGAPTVWFTNRA
ncbi:cyclase (plasmid) [Rhizobium leguminosarum]|nr:cyclase [Rhizobium leguminosarum]TAV82377.1 cyclase [Rhizobium leguminosarum]TAV86227.1 cyclase [Rhizobium leguminosarum]TAW27435.1 cyclase [Rhizobium leguminosarum]